MKIKDVVTLEKMKKKNRGFICSNALPVEMHKELYYYYELMTNQTIDEIGELELNLPTEGEILNIINPTIEHFYPDTADRSTPDFTFMLNRNKKLMQTKIGKTSHKLMVDKMKGE